MSIITLPFLSPDQKKNPGIYHNNDRGTNFKTNHDMLAQGLITHLGPGMVVLMVLMTLRRDIIYYIPSYLKVKENVVDK